MRIFFYDYRMNGQKQVVVVTEKGIIQGFSLTKNINKYDLSNDAEAKAASEKQLELSRKKIELTNQITKLKERKAALQRAAKNQPEADGGSASSAAVNLSLPTCDDV